VALLLEIKIPGEPVGAGRPRVVRLKNGHSHTFMPDKSAAWEALAIEQIQKAWGERQPVEQPVAVRVTAIVGRPLRLMRKKDPKGRIWAPCKPDIDNILKLAMDALVKAGVLADDKAVTHIEASKSYASEQPLESPHVEISIGDLA